MTPPDPRNPKVGDEFVDEHEQRFTVIHADHSTHVGVETGFGGPRFIDRGFIRCCWRPAPPPEPPLVDGSVVLVEHEGATGRRWLSSNKPDLWATGCSIELAVKPIDEVAPKAHWDAANAGRQVGVWWERERT